MPIRIVRAGGEFSDWAGLLRLLQDAFAYTDGRIDPPSSLHRMTPASLAAKAQEESLFLATEEGALVGCVFARRQEGSLYVSKLAVRQDRRRNGVGRRLMDSVEREAREGGLRNLELDTRIELTENHATFAAMGYAKTAQRAHEGYDRPTYITMRKPLTGDRVEIVEADASHLDEVRRLFRAYADSLGFDLEFQGFTEELRSLPGEYRAPAGAILVAELEKQVVGCLAVRPLGAGACEMKRLYVSPPARRTGAGRALVEAAVRLARERGYERMRLDTIGSMEAARSLYESLGFRETAAYRHNPLPDARFYELLL
jgi:ribosomal protein S18 acetylase RimI-like enzyme